MPDFDSDFVSIDKLLAVIEDLDSEIEVLKEKISDLEKSEQERYENYKWNRADEFHDLKKIGEIWLYHIWWGTPYCCQFLS